MDRGGVEVKKDQSQLNTAGLPLLKTLTASFVNVNLYSQVHMLQYLACFPTIMCRWVDKEHFTLISAFHSGEHSENKTLKDINSALLLAMCFLQRLEDL